MEGSGGNLAPPRHGRYDGRESGFLPTPTLKTEDAVRLTRCLPPLLLAPPVSATDAWAARIEDAR
jgi:hypothetical protein